jgi:hypothetical protein
MSSLWSVTTCDTVCFVWLLSLAINEHEIRKTFFEFTFAFMKPHNHSKFTLPQLFEPETALSVSDYG